MSPYQPSPAMRAWLTAEEFVRTDDRSDCWEQAWPHTVGYGYITLRLCPNDFGWELLVLDGSGQDRRCVDLGDASTLDQIQQVYAALKGLQWHGALPPRRQSDALVYAEESPC